MIKQFFKKVLISYLIIICCIYTPTAQAAGLSFGSYAFSSSTLNITKNGVKVAAKIPTSSITPSIGKRILGGVSGVMWWANAFQLLTSYALDSVDWLMDPENNAVKYKPKGKGGIFRIKGNFFGVGEREFFGSTVDSVCSQYFSFTKSLDSVQSEIKNGKTYNTKIVGSICYAGLDGNYLWHATAEKILSDYKSLSIPVLSNKVYDVAKGGDVIAQTGVTESIKDAVNAGELDKIINEAVSASCPYSTHYDGSSCVADVIKTDEADNTNLIPIPTFMSAMPQNLWQDVQGIKSVINTSIDKLLNKQDQIKGELVNTGSKIDSVGGQVVGVGDKVDNVGGKVVGLNDSVDKVGDKVVGVGDKVDATGDKVGTKVDAVGDKVTGVGADVRGVGDKVDATGDKVGTKVDAVGDKVTGVGADVRSVGDKVDATGDKVADAVKESTKEITKKMDETKPKDFELPAFCSWATKVCDFIDWVKSDPRPADDGTLSESTKDYDWQSKANGSYVNFGGSCPAPVQIPISYMGASTDLTISYTPFCQFATMIKPAVILSAYIAGLMIISGGRTKE